MHPVTNALAATIAADRRREAATARLARTAARARRPVPDRSRRLGVGLTAASNALGLRWLSNALAATTDDDDRRRSEHARP